MPGRGRGKKSHDNFRQFLDTSRQFPTFLRHVCLFVHVTLDRERLETICIGGPQDPQARKIALVFRGDHYDAVAHPSIADMDSICLATSFRPWSSQQQHQMRGGFTIRNNHGPTRRLEILRKARIRGTEDRLGETNDTKTKRAQECGIEEGKHLTVSGEQSVITWNVGGWRTQKIAILAVLEEKKPLILLLQEARVAQDHRRGFEHFFKRAGYRVIFGECPSWVRNKRGTQRIDQNIPGVVCLYKDSETVAPQTLFTPAAKESYYKGRLQMLRWEHTQGSILIANVYSYSGTHRKYLREEFSTMLMGEVARQGTDRVLLGGDWNENPHENPLIAQLTCNRGWWLLPLLDLHDRPQQGTFNAQQESWLDAFVIGRGIHLRPGGQCVIEGLSTQHKPVMLQGWSRQGTLQPTLNFPPHPKTGKSTRTYRFMTEFWPSRFWRPLLTFADTHTHTGRYPGLGTRT